MWWSARAGPPRPRGCCEGVRVRLPGVMRGAVEGVGVRGSAVMVRSGRLRACWGSRARRVGCRGRSGRRRGRFRRPCRRRSSRMVGRRLACRDAARLASTSLNPRARTSSRRSRGLSDVLGGYPTISRTAAPRMPLRWRRAAAPHLTARTAAPRTSRRAPRPRERRLEHRGPTAHEWPEQENATMSPLNNLQDHRPVCHACLIRPFRSAAGVG